MLRSYSSLLRMHWVKTRIPTSGISIPAQLVCLPTVETSHPSTLLLGSSFILTRMAAFAIVVESKRDIKEPANPNKDD
jgi:hypothetical protein